MKKLRDIFSNTDGTAFPLIVAVTLALMVILVGISEYMRLMIIATGVREAVQSAIISVVNDNYDNVYRGVREGYSGGYVLDESTWKESIDYGDIFKRLDDTLGLQTENGCHTKYSGESAEYILSGLSVKISNVTLAPSDPRTPQCFLADATIHLEVPVYFGGNSLPSVSTNLKVQAKYTPIF